MPVFTANSTNDAGNNNDHAVPCNSSTNSMSNSTVGTRAARARRATQQPPRQSPITPSLASTPAQ
eukprot:13103615-Alexandrium_andersonii.AAC.1